ncbi:unnamed protein product [Zymoseptoria tritici ST99CH_1A5]|uniref:CBM1 domain-containing protein n=2 Tax=Zymoseptoria tritici TaxID=1047171 RepID=A0A2H1H5C9_ZYMTR|nr:unnamed protein product [Zymoseptoria tritici ST99CH_1E4]SMY29494.1 unnamed protein product [Zymoseptoria tritici ST99CH_1A5]
MNLSHLLLLLSLASSSLAWFYCYNPNHDDGYCKGEDTDKYWGSQPCWEGTPCQRKGGNGCTHDAWANDPDPVVRDERRNHAWC